MYICLYVQLTPLYEEFGAGIAQSVWMLTMGWLVQSLNPHGLRNFPFWLALGSTQPHLQWVEQPFPVGKFAGCIALTPNPWSTKANKGYSYTSTVSFCDLYACLGVAFIHFYLHHEDVGFAECHRVLLNWTLVVIFSEVYALKILLQIWNCSKIFDHHFLPSTYPLFKTKIKLKINIRLQKDRTVRLISL